MAVLVVNIFAASDYESQIRRAADVLRGGGIVVLPTETVYGAAGLLGNATSRKRLHELRSNPDGPPFTIHIAAASDAARYLGVVNDFGKRLMRKLWPGPVGLVFEVPQDRRRAVAKEIGVPESDLFDTAGEIMLRCPDNIIAQDVIASMEEPVAIIRAGDDATTPGPAMIAALDGKADLLIDAGPARYNKASTILKVSEDGYQIVREGVFDARIIERLLRTTVLFVCSGNTCRSPMAEAIARRLLADRAGVTEPELEKKGITVASAGAFAMPGSRATPQAVDAVRGLGADLSRHRSQPLTVELIHQADMIFAMSRGHAAAVMSLVPAASDKVMTLDPQGDIEDPIGADLHHYQDLAKQLQALIEQRLNEKELLAAG